jgi:hypothetical protein
MKKRWIKLSKLEFLVVQCALELVADSTTGAFQSPAFRQVARRFDLEVVKPKKPKAPKLPAVETPAVVLGFPIGEWADLPPKKFTKRSINMAEWERTQLRAATEAMLEHLRHHAAVPGTLLGPGVEDRLDRLQAMLTELDAP